MFKFKDLTLGVSFAPGFKMEGSSVPWADIALGGLNFVGGLVSNATNKKIAREQMAQQERFFNTQMDYVKAADQRKYDYADLAWQRETDYNDPANQRARFEAAGLNPSMMMQGQNAAIGSMQDVAGGGTPPSAPSPIGYQYQDPVAPAVNAYLQSRLLNSQVEKNQEEAYQTQVDNRTRAIENIGKLYELRSRIQLNIADARNKDKNTDLLDKQLQLVDKEIEYQTRSMDSRVLEAENRARLVGLEGDSVVEDVYRKNLENAFLGIEKVLNFEISRAQKRRLEGLIYLDQKQADKVIAETAKEWLERDGLTPGTPQWEQKERQIEAQIKNALRVGLPFGISVPGDDVNSSEPVFGAVKQTLKRTYKTARKSASRGRLY